MAKNRQKCKEYAFCLYMLSICVFYRGAFPLTTKVTSFHAPIFVNQDEVLLPDCMEGVLIVRDPEEGDIRIDADANLSTGAITVAEQDEDSIAGKMKDGRDMFIDFGNGVEHPVAINEEQQEEADDTFFYLEQE